MTVNLWGVDEVHLKQTGLQMSFGRPVVLQSVQQERRALLDQVALHEHVYNLPLRSKERRKARPKRVIDVTKVESLPSVHQLAQGFRSAQAQSCFAPFPMSVEATAQKKGEAQKVLEFSV